MSEQNIQEGQVENTQQGNVEQKEVQQEANVTEKLDQIKQELQAELEGKYKNEIAGLNRKVTEYQNIVKEKELEGKTEAEQKEMLLKEKENILKEIEELNRGRLIDQELNNAGLPLDFAKRIIGKDEANIKDDIKGFSDYLDKLANEKADRLINEKMGGKPPEGGQTPDNNILTPEEIAKLPTKEARIEALKKAGYKQ